MVLYETLIIAPMVCLGLNYLTWYRHEYMTKKLLDEYHVYNMARFDLAVVLYVMGATAMSLLISKLFK